LNNGKYTFFFFFNMFFNKKGKNRIPLSLAKILRNPECYRGEVPTKGRDRTGHALEL